MNERRNQLTIRTVIASGAIIALIAMIGSLYASEGLGFYPCELCWYQRIFMYPLVIILGIAALDYHAQIYRTALVLREQGSLRTTRGYSLRVLTVAQLEQTVQQFSIRYLAYSPSLI